MRSASLVAVLLCLLAAAGAQGPCTAPGPEPEVPGWAKTYNPLEEKSEEPIDDYLRNVAVVEAANAEGARLDVVMLGDSITSHLASLYPEVWDEAFEGLKAVPLGVYGNTVKELAWRLMLGREKLEVAPRAVIINIGINDRQYKRSLEETTERLDLLLAWLASTWPSSDFILHNLLPTREFDLDEANAEWELLAAKHGMNFSTCGAELDPNDPAMLSDEVHPAEEGYRLVLPCLREEVDALLAADRCGTGPRSGEGIVMAPSASRTMGRGAAAGAGAALRGARPHGVHRDERRDGAAVR